MSLEARVIWVGHPRVPAGVSPRGDLWGSLAPPATRLADPVPPPRRVTGAGDAYSRGAPRGVPALGRPGRLSGAGPATSAGRAVLSCSYRSSSSWGRCCSHAHHAAGRRYRRGDGGVGRAGRPGRVAAAHAARRPVYRGPRASRYALAMLREGSPEGGAATLRMSDTAGPGRSATVSPDVSPALRKLPTTPTRNGEVQLDTHRRVSSGCCAPRTLTADRGAILRHGGSVRRSSAVRRHRPFRHVADLDKPDPLAYVGGR